MSIEAPSGDVRPAAPTSSMAIISLVASILGFTFLPLIGSIVAVITGPMAKKEILASGGAMGGEGLATAGTIIGWVGIGLSVVGLCVVGTLVAIPLCLAFLGIATSRSTSMLPLLLAAL